MRVLISPMETFFFRDARPFDRGEGWARGIFPPLPSTFYGAFRTAAISQNCALSEYYSKDNPIEEEMGSPTHCGAFSIKSIALFDGISPLFPIPLDLLQSGPDLEPLEPCRDHVISDVPFPLYVAKSVDLDIPAIPWLEAGELRKYLLGEPIVKACSHDPLVEELKTGIQKDRERGNAEEHMLYVQRMLRLKDGYCFAIEAENITGVTDRGSLKLGHDGRVFSYEKMHRESNCQSLNIRQEFINQLKKNGGNFKLIFTSPAILKRGWLPGDAGSSDKDYTWLQNGLKIKVESAVIGAPMRVGGWDMKQKAPKPMMKAVPPGSVYYCKMEEGDTGALFDSLFDNNLSDGDPELAKQGFGHTLIGVRNN